MNRGVDPVAGIEASTATASRVVLYSAILTAVTTAVTFGLAITAVPNAGAGCQVACVEYPYLDTLSEFPGDYLWMPPAMILVVLYVVLVSSIDEVIEVPAKQVTLPAPLAVRVWTNSLSPPREKISSLTKIHWRAHCFGQRWVWPVYRFGSSPGEQPGLLRGPRSVSESL